MNFFILFIFALFVNGISAQFQSKRQFADVIRCTKHEQCVQFLGSGATCKNLSCVCENEEECTTNTLKIKARFKSNVIGEECTENFDCNVQFSICKDRFCVCESTMVASIDRRKCLKVSEGLDKNCTEDSQCIKAVKGSVCRNDVCVCDEIHHHEKGSTECLQKAGLGQSCTNHSDCNHIIHAVCGLLIRCECDEGFIESASRTKCLPVATKALDNCEENQQCEKLFSYGGICMYGKCECDAVHRVANLTACPSRLKQPCADDNECKSYTDDLTMHCEMSRCECSDPYVEENGVCNGSGMQKFTMLSLIIAFVIIKILVFS